LRGLRELLSGVEWISDVRPESFGTLVKVERRDVSGGRFLNCRLFTRRDFGLEVVGDRVRDLALDCKNICQIAVVAFRPKMRVCPGVNQLRGYANAVPGALHAAFEHVRNAELLGDLAQVPIYGVLVLHHACTTDYF